MSHGVRFPGEKGSICPGCLNKELKSRKLGKNEVVVGCSFDIEDIEVDDSVLDSFGIKLMAYSEGQKLQKAKDPSLKGKQLEHLIPNSSMVSGVGRKAPPVIGASAYSEGIALIMPVGDDQSHGTEHKFLTDRERFIDKKLEAEGKFATVDQKTSMMVPVWKETFMKFKKSDYTGTDFEGDCEKAAILLAQKLKAHNKKVGINGKTRTRNGIVKGSKAPKKKIKKSEITDI